MSPPRTILCALALLAALAAPSLASAHTGAGVATDYRIHLDGLAPPAPGATLRVWGGDDRLQLTWRGPGDLVVLGYAGEPYLRFGPGGVYENSRSPSVAANETRYGTVTQAPGVDARAAPVWRRVSSSPTAVWHDHRSHWMSRTPPPGVRAHGGRAQVVQPVSIPVRIDGRPARIVGRLDYEPPPPTWAWVAGILALGLVGALAARRPGRPGRTAARAAALAAAGGGVAVAVAEWLAAPTEGLTSGAGGLSPQLRIALWLAGFAVAAAAWVLAARRGPAREAVVLVAAAWLLGGGAALGRLGYLTHEIVPSALPAGVARALVALALAGLAAPAVWAWRVLGEVREAGRRPRLGASASEGAGAAR